MWTRWQSAVLVLSLLATVPANADPSFIDDWYAALMAADQDKLAAMLSPDVKVRLLDLNVVQSKDEFIASLDEWQKAAAGAAVKHRVVATDSDITTVLACYDFPANEVLMSETFRVVDNLLVENVQRMVAENCDEY
jgi:hypothetical protein